jgi:DNA-binding CsgD family transcriptional regulator
MANRKYKGRKKWTPEEEERLRKLYQKYTKSDIAKKLGRTPSSITNKKNALEIDSMMDVTELWNFNQLSDAVGKSRGAVNKSWVANGLKFVKRGCYCLVEEKEVLRFMQEHPRLWDATKCDYYLFYQYPWFLKKLEEDRKKPANAKKYFWTDYEKSILVTLKKRGLSHKEIAKRLGRTKKAIDGMVSLMGLTKKVV